MIVFACHNCGKSFTVGDEHAGRSARCKACGATVTVPAAEPSQPAVKIPMRTRRLRADAEAIAATFADFPIIRAIPVAGDPPETYHVAYAINSLQRGADGKPQPCKFHKVEIQLTAEYPRISPKCTMLTPIFHPNIDTSSICVGDHWTAGERLADLIIRIGQMIAFQEYNIRSPLDAEAAMWADLNVNLLPIDARDIRPPTLP
jgi:ubiquitin-protein ligase/DNA-directed RNA polymerase subunit RPC12/RpoP